MNQACIDNEFVSRKLKVSASGINIYKKIWRKYHRLRNSAGTFVLVFPESDLEIEQYLAENLTEFLAVRHYGHYILVAKEPLLSALSQSSLCLGEDLLTEQQMKDLMQAFSFCFGPTNCQIASLDLPVGRRGSNIFSFPGITKEDILKYGLFTLGRVENNKAAPSIYYKLKLVHFVVTFVKYFFLYPPADFLTRIYDTLFLEKGRQTYRELLAAYPEHMLFPAPYPGTGDVYVAAMILKEYARREHIDQFIVPVIGGSNVKICSLFGIKAVSLRKEEMKNLMRFLSFVGFSESESFILHHDPPTLSIGFLDRMRNVKGIDFFSMYLSGVFNSNDRTMIASPSFNCQASAIDKLFQDHGLIQGRTILLAPYNYTLPKMKLAFWERLAEQLTQRGYTVCTNCCGKKEKPIKGTVPIFIPYTQIVPFIEAAGCIIAIRSGLCEIISSAKCRKIILYLAGFTWNGKDNIDYFSLNRMGLCDDAEEYTYTNGVAQLLLADKISESFAYDVQI